VQELWGALMDRASAYRDTLPVYLLVSITTPRQFHPKDPRAKDAEEQAAVTERAVRELEERPQIGKVLVKVLPPLQRLTVDYVAGFLTSVQRLERAQARAIALGMVGTDDNEEIIARMRDYYTLAEGA
jgi:hypothetical protein